MTYSQFTTGCSLSRSDSQFYPAALVLSFSPHQRPAQIECGCQPRTCEPQGPMAVLPGRLENNVGLALVQCPEVVLSSTGCFYLALLLAGMRVLRCLSLFSLRYSLGGILGFRCRVELTCPRPQPREAELSFPMFIVALCLCTVEGKSPLKIVV